MPLWSNTGTVSGRPTWANTDDSTLYGNTYPVLPTEVNATNTKVQGIQSGWVSGKSYADTHGDTRYKFETLVTMRSMSNTTLYTTNPLTGHINVATASTAIKPAVRRVNTKLTGKVATNAVSMYVTGTGSLFQVELAAGDVVRWNGTHLGTVNTVISNTSLHLKAVAGFANANSLFYKVADTTNTAFVADVSVGYQLQIANSIVRTVTAVNSTQITVNANVGTTNANTTIKRWINVTGPKFFHV